MTLRARIEQGALTFAHLAGLRPSARLPASVAMHDDDGPTAEEIAQREANEAAVRLASLTPAPAANVDPADPVVEVVDPEEDPEDKPTDIEELRARVEELERRLPPEGSEAAATTAERARCSAIIGAPEAAADIQLACQLAFGTDMTAEAAIEALKAAATTKRPGLDARMTGQTINPLPPATPVPDKAQAISSSWDNAFAAVRRR